MTSGGRATEFGGIHAIDHLVLTVRSVDETVRWYHDVLAVGSERFSEDRVALRVGDQKVNLHEVGREIVPHARMPTSGSGDLCLLTRDLNGVIERIRAAGARIEEGPVPRTGARGPITSVYLRDPDGNLVEVACYD